MEKIAGIVFDKDGTLFDFTRVWGAWCENVLGEVCADDKALAIRLAKVAGYDFQQRRFMAGSSIVNAAAEETNQLWADQLPDWSVAQLEVLGLRHLETLELAPVADLAVLFSDLKSRGLKLGLATNDYEAAAHTQLQQAGVEQCFDFVCGFDSGFGAKPGSGMIDAFCQAAGLPPAAVAMVGDSTHDLRAGQAAGVALRVGVLTGPALSADLQADADVILPDISFLADYLAKQGLL